MAFQACRGDETRAPRSDPKFAVAITEAPMHVPSRNNDIRWHYRLVHCCVVIPFVRRAQLVQLHPTLLP